MIQKIFVEATPRKLMAKVAHFIDEYGLILVKCEIEIIEDDLYQAKIKYKLGLREDEWISIVVKWKN